MNSLFFTRKCGQIFGLILLGLLFSPSFSYAATYTVTKTADTNDGTCDADCSLREAVASANSNSGADMVTFSIPTSDGNYSSSEDNWTITLASSLTISASQDIVFDGSTQTGATSLPTYGGKVVLLTTTNVSTITGSATSDLTLKNLTIKNTSSTIPLPVTGSTKAVTVQYCYFTRDVQATTSQNALALTTTGNVNISNNKFEFWGRGPSIANSTVGTTVTYDSNVVLSPTSIGLRTTSANNLTITNNTITGASDQAIAAVCNSGSACVARNNTITNTTCVSCFASIAVSGAGSWLVENNTISSQNIRGISMSSGGTIQNNTIYGSGSTSNTQNGKIHVDTNSTSKPVTIQNNTVDVTSSIPIWITSTSTRAHIKNNIISSDFGYTMINLSGGTEDSTLSTANDTGDSDDGVNNLTNYPIINTVEYKGSGIYHIVGSFEGNSSEGPWVLEICKSSRSNTQYGGCSQTLKNITLTQSGVWSTDVVVIGDDESHLSTFSVLATNNNYVTSEFGPTRLGSLMTTSNHDTRKAHILAYSGGSVFEQGILSLVPEKTFIWDAYLSVNKKTSPITINSQGRNYNIIGSLYEVWWTSFQNNAKIIATDTLKPYTIAIPYKNIDLGKNVNEKKLKLGYSFDGKKWTILPSVLDTKNKTVAVVTKNGGWYALVTAKQEVFYDNPLLLKQKPATIFDLQSEPNPPLNENESITQTSTNTPHQTTEIKKKSCFFFLCW